MVVRSQRVSPITRRHHNRHKRRDSRRMDAFEPELLRPSFLPQLAETALGAMRLWSFRAKPLPA